MRLSSYVSRCRNENILYWIRKSQDTRHSSTLYNVHLKRFHFGFFFVMLMILSQLYCDLFYVMLKIWLQVDKVGGYFATIKRRLLQTLDLNVFAIDLTCAFPEQSLRFL